MRFVIGVIVGAVGRPILVRLYRAYSPVIQGKLADASYVLAHQLMSYTENHSPEGKKRR